MSDRQPQRTGWMWGWFSVWIGVACTIAGYAFDVLGPGMLGMGLCMMLIGTKMISDSARSGE